MHDRKCENHNMTERTEEFDMFSYQNAYHQTTLMDNFNEFYQTQTLCDITLVAEGREIRAHKTVLAACSPYFASMFMSNLKERYQDVIELKNITFQSLETLISFCYTSRLEVPGERIFDLLTAADMLQFLVIKESTCVYISSKVTPSNCIEISVFADVHNCNALKEFSETFARENFRHVSRSEAFKEADFSQVYQLMSSPSLGITSEKDVFEAMMFWIKHDQDAREEYLASLLSLVRLKQLYPKELIDCVEREPLIAKNTKCMQMINDAKTHHLLCDWTIDDPLLELQSRSIHNEAKVYLIGGEIHQKVFKSVEMYSMAKNEWELVRELNIPRDGCGVCSYDGKIFATGGCDAKEALSSMEVYDPHNDKWEFRSSMNQARHALCVTELNGWLYAIGGGNFTTEEYSSTERYDPVRDNWCNMPAMNAKREGLAAMTLDGVIYAMGGDNGVCILNSVERFDPRTGKWYFSTPMGFRRRYFGGAVLNDKIYVVGGSDFDEDLNSVECFDPRANRWQFLPSMSMRRESVAVTAYCDKILALGGACINKETNSGEAYDPILNKWEAFTPMLSAKEGMVAAVL